MTKRRPSLTIVRRIKAPPAEVYAALTEPKLMVRWWGPDAGPTLSAEADVRPGGRFERLPDEGARNSHEGGWRGFLDKLQVFLGGPAWPT